MANLLKHQRALISAGHPFFAYREPGSTEIHVHAGTGSLCFGPVSVKPWPGSIVTSNVPSVDTPREYYLDEISAVISQLKETGGKVAIQRVITGTFAGLDLVELVEEFFGTPTPTLDFVLYDRTAGYWLGRSPELLLESDDNIHYATRALAGTRPIAEVAEWSDKNIHEHELVVTDITARLTKLGLSVDIEPRTDFSCGAVTHLLTPIIATDTETHSGMFGRIVSELHPTPAVGGYPRESAAAVICKAEKTQRELYGGVINIDNREAYVVLRCAHFNLRNWAVYTGSGITQHSDPHDEWNETKEKAKPLIKFLSRF